MKREKNIIFISHCILNQNTVVEPLAREAGPYRDIVNLLIEKGIGIHQLPCPEYRALGLDRKPMTKEEYDTKEYRNLSRELAEDTLSIVKEYLKNDYKIVGLIGINESPTCSIRNKKGIFMEELLSKFQENKIDMALIDVDTSYRDGEEAKEFLEELNIFIEKGLA